MPISRPLRDSFHEAYLQFSSGHRRVVMQFISLCGDGDCGGGGGGEGVLFRVGREEEKVDNGTRCAMRYGFIRQHPKNERWIDGHCENGHPYIDYESFLSQSQCY